MVLKLNHLYVLLLTGLKMWNYPKQPLNRKTWIDGYIKKNIDLNTCTSTN